jgi:hypothetical protein
VKIKMSQLFTPRPKRDGTLVQTPGEQSFLKEFYKVGCGKSSS